MKSLIMSSTLIPKIRVRKGKKKKVQLPLEHSGPPKLYSLSLLMCYIRRKSNLNMRDIMKT